ncbi:MAG: hypothetical protein Q4Q23_02210 [Methanobacteriaceae archaeon]|nr:hypothetical protein [Methanobacteriaceae archaeon]
MDNKLKVIIAIVIIAIVTIGGYFAYSSYMNENFSTNMASAVNCEVSIQNIANNNSASTTVDQTEQVNQIINKLNEEKTHLNNAKSFTINSAEKQYVDLQLEKVDIEIAQYNDLLKTYATSDSFDMETMQEIHKIDDDYTNQVIKLNENQKQVKDLLSKNSDLNKVITGLPDINKIEMNGFLGNNVINNSTFGNTTTNSTT